MLSSTSDKAKLFAKNFSKNSNLDAGISLPVFPSRTNLKLHNISVTFKMVKKVIMNLDFSKASGPDCIPVVLLKNCGSELSYILAELFFKCLEDSCFPDCWKVSSVVPVFKNVGERSTAKNYHPVSLLSVVSKVFEKLVNNRIVDHLQKCGLFSDFQYGFRSSRSTADLLTVVSDRIARAFNKSGATQAVALDISKAFDRVWHAGLLHKLKSYGISGQIISGQVSLFLLFLIIDGFEWFWIESLHKNIQLILEFLKAPFLVLHFSCYTIMTFLTMSSVILLSMLMILLFILIVTRHLTCGNNLNWLVNLNLIYKTLWTGVRSGLKYAGKTQLVSFDWSNNNGSIDVKMDGSVLYEKSSFKMLGLTFSSKLDWGSYIISIAETASKKIGALIRSMKFLSPDVALCLYKSSMRPCMEYYCHVWADAPSCYLELLDKLQKQICGTVGPSLAASLEPLAHRRKVASLNLFYRYYFGRCYSELAQLAPLPFSQGRSTHYSDCMIFVIIPRCYKDVYVNSFFPRTA